MKHIIENLPVIGIGSFLLLAFVALMLAFKWREVVSTNVVHIVQSRAKTTSYGTGQPSGNVYYAIPSFIPVFGLSRTVLPVNNFNLDLNDYRAYDKDRVPFVLHVTAFFRIADTNKAAERVQGFEELKGQLELVVKGAVRKILASHDIHGIMTDRATFGKQFTEEVATELQNWGVEPVKNMELMDIKDDQGSQVIANIMAKKSSHIEMESRVEVATNKQKAETAEIEAKRTIELTNIEAKRVTELSVIDANQVIGEKHAAQEKSVGVAKEKAAQDIKGEAATTMEREMKILAVQTQRKAELEKAAGVVKAEETAAVTKTVAEGNLEKARREAEAVRLAGEAKAAAEKAMQLAPVEAQIVLAKEIGENQGYQTYLVTLRKVEAEQAIGIAQAASLEKADIKIIANSGSASAGLGSLGELISSKGGQQVGAFLDGLKNTETGGKLVDKVAGNGRATA